MTILTGNMPVAGVADGAAGTDSHGLLQSLGGFYDCETDGAQGRHASVGGWLPSCGTTAQLHALITIAPGGGPQHALLDGLLGFPGIAFKGPGKAR